MCNFQPTLQLIAHLVNIFSICSVIVFGAKWLSTTESLWHQSKHLQSPEVHREKQISRTLGLCSLHVDLHDLWLS